MLIASLVKGQQSSPTQAVEKYFEYYIAGDTNGLKEVFHEDFTLSYISPWEKGKAAYKKVSRAQMMRFFNANWSKLSISCTKNDVEIKDNIAHCTAVVRIDGILEWTDYITMIKIESNWWIISKSSTGKILKRHN